MKQIGVLGAGTWGMALARLLCNKGYRVVVWSALPAEIDELQRTRRHRNLPEMVIPEAMEFTRNLEDAVLHMDLILFAVPSPFVRKVAAQAAPLIHEGQVIADVAKGLEADSFCTMSEIIEEELKKTGLSQVPVVALSGPTHAEEVSVDLPTTIVAVCENLEAAGFVQDLFMTDCFRVYTGTDKRGAELGGALKNVIAFAVGISNGVGYGDNARAAIITRGMFEITRLGVAMGCREQTFGGLTGMGDLIVTATSRHSRNNRAGFLVGTGLTVDQAVQQVGMVVEGLNTLPAARQLANKFGIDTPIMTAVEDIVTGRLTPAQAAALLMGREKKLEQLPDGDTAI